MEEEEGKRGAVDAVDGLDGPPFCSPPLPPSPTFSLLPPLSLRRERCVGMAAVVAAYRTVVQPLTPRMQVHLPSKHRASKKRGVFTSGEKLRVKSKLPECLWLNAETPAVLRSAGEERGRVGSRGGHSFTGGGE